MDNKLGEMGGLCPLFFDGAVCQFSELPRPDNKSEIDKVYKYLNAINAKSQGKAFLSFSIKNIINKFKTNESINFS